MTVILPYLVIISHSQLVSSLLGGLKKEFDPVSLIFFLTPSYPNSNIPGVNAVETLTVVKNQKVSNAGII